MNSKTALRILSLGLIAMLCECNKKPPVEEPAEGTVDVDAVPAVKPDPSTYVYGTPYDTANNPVYRDARDAANEAAYTGKRLAYEGVWINKEILKVYQETNSPALAAENGVVSEISLSRDSVSVTFFARWSRSGPIKFTAKDRIVAECEDSALLKVLGQDGYGVFPAPLAIADTVRSMFEVQQVGRLTGARERFFAISPEKRLKNPAVVAICDRARESLFKT